MQLSPETKLPIAIFLFLCAMAAILLVLTAPRHAESPPPVVAQDQSVRAVAEQNHPAPVKPIAKTPSTPPVDESAARIMFEAWLIGRPEAQQALRDMQTWWDSREVAKQRSKAHRQKRSPVYTKFAAEQTWYAGTETYHEPKPLADTSNWPLNPPKRQQTVKELHRLAGAASRRALEHALN